MVDHSRECPTKLPPLVDEVDFTDINPEYGHVWFPNGKESTVPVRDLDPCVIRSDNNMEQVNAYDEGIMTNSKLDQSQSDEITADIPESSTHKDSEG